MRSAGSTDGSLHVVEAEAVRIEIVLSLPTDSATVAVARDLAVGALATLEVVEEDIDDVRLALSEASTNVIEHSQSSDDYEVRLDLTEDLCEIRVVDRGRGADFSARERGMPPPEWLGGRGIAIIEAVVDRATFYSEPEHGTVVHLVKQFTRRL